MQLIPLTKLTKHSLFKICHFDRNDILYFVWQSIKVFLLTCRALRGDRSPVKGGTVFGNGPNLAGSPDGDGLEWLVSSHMEPRGTLKDQQQDVRTITSYLFLTLCYDRHVFQCACLLQLVRKASIRTKNKKSCFQMEGNVVMCTAVLHICGDIRTMKLKWPTHQMV